MRKGALLISALAFSSVFSGLITSNAANCTPANASPATQQRTGTDPFGSCEDTNGRVQCGSGTEIGTGGSGATSFGYLIADPSKGVQLCAANNQTGLPISGRITVYKHTGNKVTVAADGDDSRNSGGASAFDRVDVDADNRKVCAARGASGTYWQKNGGHTATGGATGEFTACTP